MLSAYKKIMAAICVLASLVSSQAVFALSTQDILTGPQTETGKSFQKLPTPSPTYSPAETVSKTLNIIFGFIGILAVSFIMYGGYLWVTSGGEQDKAKKAQGLLVDAVIGLVVLATVWTLGYIVIKTLAEQVIKPL